MCENGKVQADLWRRRQTGDLPTVRGEHGVEGRRLPAGGSLSYNSSLKDLPEIYGFQSGLQEQVLRLVCMLSHSSECH